MLPICFSGAGLSGNIHDVLYYLSRLTVCRTGRVDIQPIEIIIFEDDIVVTKKKTAKKTAVVKKKAVAKPAETSTVKKVAKKKVSKKKTSKKTVSKKTAQRAQLTFEQRYQKIEEAAYLIAEKSNFAPGNEVRNWLLAEQQIDAWIAADNIELVR